MPSIVQSSGKQTGDNVTTKTITVSGVVAGNTLIAVFWYFGSPASPLISVSDGDGAYTLDASHRMSGASPATGVGIFRLNNATAGTHNVVLNLVAAASYVIGAVLEVSTLSGLGLFLDVNARANGASTSPTGTTNTTQDAVELVVAALSCEANQASITVASTTPAWTEIAEELNYSSHVAGESDYKITTAAGTYTAAWTLATSTNWSMVIATYREIASGGGGGTLAAVF